MDKNQTIEKDILELYKTPSFQRLSTYYRHSTIFNVLGVERSENRHSAFLAWLLNPESSHGLKEAPLRKFLALVASFSDTMTQCSCQLVREILVTGNYLLKVDCVETEQTIIGLADDNLERFKDFEKKDAQNRFDIWILLRIRFTDTNDNKQEWCLPIVIENKIYSKEGGAKNSKPQTERYYEAVNELYPQTVSNNQPLLVFLTGPDAGGPHNESFIHITYQDILDHVVLPCKFLSTAEGVSMETKVLLDGYIRNLSCPSNKDGERIKDYSILAIAETESSDLNTIFESVAFKKALCARYRNEARSLFANTMDNCDADITDNDASILEQFWNTNEDLFKIVLYNKYNGDKEKMKVVNKIIKVSNRDNTRYYIYRKDGERLVKLNRDGKPVPKSEASFLIFKAFCLQWSQKHSQEKLTIDRLREAFPGTLNSYYHDRFLNYLFYDFKDVVIIDIKSHSSYNTVIEKGSGTWDFYWDDAHRLPIDDCDVRSVKMWRKPDFDRLLERAKELEIIVEPKE